MRILISFFLVFVFSATAGQEKPDAKLFIQLKAADSLLFDEGFNKCRMDVLEELIDEDLVFLHDQGGMQDREAFFEAIKKNICSNALQKPIRKLESNSLLVYPLKNNGELYGAVQMGIHKFFLAEPEKPLRPTSVARFTHTWLLKDGKWKLFQVLSYDHKPL